MHLGLISGGNDYFIQAFVDKKLRVFFNFAVLGGHLFLN